MPLMGGVLRSEWTKFYSSPWCLLGLIAAILTAPIIIITNSGTVNIEASSELYKGLQVMILAQAGIALMAGSFFGQEYDQSTLRTSLLAVPNRKKYLAAKFGIISIITLSAAIISGLLCLLVTIFFSSTLTAYISLIFMGKIAIVSISFVFIAIICGSLAIITKSQIIPIAIMLSLILGLSQMLFYIVRIAKFLPDLATMNLFLTEKSSGFLAEWQGILVAFSWALILAFIASIKAIRRDVG